MRTDQPRLNFDAADAPTHSSCATRRRAAWRSIRRATSHSRPRQAPARRASWSIGTSACSCPGSSRATFLRSPSLEKPLPKCDSEFWMTWGADTARAASTPSCGARFARASLTSPSPRSMRFVSPCCANFRWRPASIRSSSWRMKRRRRVWSARRSIRHSGSAGRSRLTRPTWRCSSPNLAIPPARRPRAAGREAARCGCGAHAVSSWQWRRREHRRGRRAAVVALACGVCHRSGRSRGLCHERTAPPRFRSAGAGCAAAPRGSGAVSRHRAGTSRARPRTPAHTERRTAKTPDLSTG